MNMQRQQAADKRSIARNEAAECILWKYRSHPLETTQSQYSRWRIESFKAQQSAQ